MILVDMCLVNMAEVLCPLHDENTKFVVYNI